MYTTKEKESLFKLLVLLESETVKLRNFLDREHNSQEGSIKHSTVYPLNVFPLYPLGRLHA